MALAEGCIPSLLVVTAKRASHSMRFVSLRRWYGGVPERHRGRPRIAVIDRVGTTSGPACQRPPPRGLPGAWRVGRVGEGAVAGDSMPRGYRRPRESLPHAPATLRNGVVPPERKHRNAVMGISRRPCLVALLCLDSLTPLKIKHISCIPSAPFPCFAGRIHRFQEDGRRNFHKRSPRPVRTELLDFEILAS